MQKMAFERCVLLSALHRSNPLRSVLHSIHSRQVSHSTCYLRVSKAQQEHGCCGISRLCGDSTVVVARAKPETHFLRGEKACVLVKQSKSFHTTPQRCVPPVLWILFKPLAKLGAILSGR